MTKRELRRRTVQYRSHDLISEPQLAPMKVNMPAKNEDIQDLF